ncbi:alpha/beta fold hydrolase [Reichenbachiella sp. MALMAid0571]|uniref:alpha/beta fold hydrolase n=1 Tax=Reichenbachiella sp. MALMAid0571 TaxID=3143939 RepID=UPI0032DF91B7
MKELLNYKVLGEGQPLIILHGLFGSLDNWITLGKRFSEHFKVVLVDQRNHGKSFHNSAFDYSVMAEDLEDLIDYLGLKNPILLGHSMGGKTVMQFAAFHPEKVAKLIVADIAPKYYPVHHELIIEGLKSVPLDSLKKRDDVEAVLSEYISEVGTRTFLMKNLKRNADGSFSWKMNLDTISNNIDEVGKELDYYLPIEVPTLFIRGGNSDYVKDDDLDDISDIFPNVQFETIIGSGHWLHADNPDKFYDIVMKFTL